MQKKYFYQTPQLVRLKLKETDVLENSGIIPKPDLDENVGEPDRQ